MTSVPSTPEGPTILVVDDEAGIREALHKIFRKEGWNVLEAANGRDALATIRARPVQVMITDLRMPGMAGDDLLKAAKALVPELEVVVMTAYGTVENAVDAMKLGAYDFVSKPLKRAAVVGIVRKALEKALLVAENRALRARLDAARGRTIVGHSQALRAVLDVAEQAAASTATVLLLGESGTGKELLANFIDANSPRRDGPFVTVKFAALPETILESELFGHEKGALTGAVRSREGRFVEADGGTLFLDEIADISPAVQVKLLRALQEGEIEPVGGRTRRVDFRLICATNRDLAQEVRAGRFREDLYYRINVIPLHVPPLRDRPEDIPLLAEHFVRRFAERHEKAVEGIEPAAIDALSAYPWPGNVRELENAIERAVVLGRGPRIKVSDLPPEVVAGGEGGRRLVTFAVGTPLAEIERRMIVETLQFTGGDKRLAADLLGIATRTIYRKLEAVAQSRTTNPSDDGVLH